MYRTKFFNNSGKMIVIVVNISITYGEFSDKLGDLKIYQRCLTNSPKLFSET